MASATFISGCRALAGAIRRFRISGMVPGAIQGILDIADAFLDRAEDMVRACGAGVAADENPGAILGVILGAAQKAGRDKVTIFASPGSRLSRSGAWKAGRSSSGRVHQQEGKGLIPS